MVQTPASAPRLIVEGAIATLSLNRPAQANRLGLDDLETLGRHLQWLHQTPDIRVMLLRGEGPHFCAGFQIDALAHTDAPALFDALGDALESLPQITLAVIHGGCWGGAVDLALACDFRLGGPNAKAGIPAARLGLHFYGSGMRRLVTRLGLGAAKRLLLAAETWEADTMRNQGFLDACGDDTEALATHWCAELLALAPLAQRGMKRHLNALAGGSLDRGLLATDMALCATSSDLAEGLAAWKERRAPRFSGC